MFIYQTMYCDVFCKLCGNNFDLQSEQWIDFYTYQCNFTSQPESIKFSYTDDAGTPAHLPPCLKCFTHLGQTLAMWACNSSPLLFSFVQSAWRPLKCHRSHTESHAGRSNQRSLGERELPLSLPLCTS